MTFDKIAMYHQVKVRLARHYLDKLRTASAAVHRGRTSVAHGIELFDQEWGQIEHWQAYSAERSGEDEDWTRLCLGYPLAGSEVLSIRQNLPDRACWLEKGLKAARQLGDLKAELVMLNELCVVSSLLGDLEKEADYASRLLNLGREEQDRLSVGRAYFAMGGVTEDQGLYVESLEHTQRALDIFTELGAKTDEARALYHLGSIALYLGDYEKAYDYFSSHLKLVESKSNMSEVCRGLLSVAQVLMILEKFTQAEPYLRRAVRLSRRLGYKRLLGAGLIMLAQWFGEQGQIDIELKYYGEGIAAARAVGSQRDVIHGLSNSGLAKMLKGDLEGALLDLQEGLEMARKAGLPRFICNIQRNIADTYLALNDSHAAHPALKEALFLAHEMGSNYQMVKALTSAIKYWQIKGEFEQAAKWTGSIINRPEVDADLFKPICDRLESVLGTGTYRQALEEGKMLDLNETVFAILDQL